MRNSERCAKEGSFSSPSFFTKGLDLPGKNQPRRSESVRRIGGVYVLNRGQGQRLFPSTQGQSCYVKCYYWGIAVVVQERGAFSVCPSLLFNRTCLGRTIYVIILKRDPTKGTNVSLGRPLWILFRGKRAHVIRLSPGVSFGQPLACSIFSLCSANCVPPEDNSPLPLVPYHTIRPPPCCFVLC